MPPKRTSREIQPTDKRRHKERRHKPQRRRGDVLRSVCGAVVRDGARADGFFMETEPPFHGGNGYVRGRYAERGHEPSGGVVFPVWAGFPIFYSKTTDL